MQTRLPWKTANAEWMSKEEEKRRQKKKKDYRFSDQN